MLDSTSHLAKRPDRSFSDLSSSSSELQSWFPSKDFLSLSLFADTPFQFGSVQRKSVRMCHKMHFALPLEVVSHQHNQCDIVVFVELCVCESSTSLQIAESLNTLSFCTFNG